MSIHGGVSIPKGKGDKYLGIILLLKTFYIK